MKANISSTLREILRFFGRPARSEKRGPIVIQAYRGYGSTEEVFLIGRVFKEPGFRFKGRPGMLGRDLFDFLRRILRRGLRHAMVSAHFGGMEKHVETDRDGYFRIHMHQTREPRADRLWHTMHISLIEPAGKDAWTTGQIFVPLGTARHVVISDIDDTIMRTGVASKLKMLWRLFFQNAESREALPGAAIFCRALHEGLSGKDWNPMLYVSRGPWTIYEMLDLFFNIHNIPVGPILFLREWGLTLQRPFPPRARDHKLRLIRNMLSLYKGYPFVLIGDSGQHDPEIYARIVRENPDRVKAIYIRNVNRDPARRLSIEKLAKEVMEAGSSLLLAEDSFAMARHAAAHHLISSKALGEILQELESREEKPTLARPRKIGSSSAGLNQASAKELKEVLEKQAIEGSHGVPVEIEPKEP